MSIKTFLMSKTNPYNLMAIGVGLVVACHLIFSDTVSAYQFPSSPVRIIAWHPNESLIALGIDDQVWLADLDGNQIREFPLDENQRPFKLKWSPNGSYLAASASGDGLNQIYIWDKTSFTVVSVIQQDLPSASEISWNEDSTELATSYYNEVRIWDVSTGQAARNLIGFDEPFSVTSVVWSPNGLYLATAGGDYEVQIWDMQTFQINQTIAVGNPSPLIAWSPSSQQLAITEIREVNILDIPSNQVIASLVGHTGTIVYLDWKGNTMVTSGVGIDETFRLWNTIDWENVAIIQGNNIDSTRRALSLNSSGTKLAYSGVDGILTIHDLNKRDNRPFA